MAERQRHDARLMTVVETREFQRRAVIRMTETERQEFITFIAGHPEDGVVMVGTAGSGKVAGESEHGAKAVVYGSSTTIITRPCQSSS
jgi:hypothetical protein